eukprot:300240_1
MSESENLNTKLEERSNWIILAKCRLKEREMKLIRFKVKQTHHIIKSELKTSTSPNATNIALRSYKISDGIIDTALAGLHEAIDDWNGLEKHQSQMNRLASFQDYYATAINKWDRKKCRISGDLFWIRVFMHVHQLALGRKSMLRIIKMLFQCNCRGSLIGIEVAQNSHQIDRYLAAIHHSLSVDKQHRRMSIHYIR